MRVLVKFGYLPDFDAFPMLDGHKTVEGTFLRAIAKVMGLDMSERAIHRKFRWEASSRTDAGVGAVENAAAFDIPDMERIKGMARILAPQGIYLHHYTTVEENFSPRREALWREYRFFLPVDTDIESLRRIGRIFHGKHDFSRFSRRDRSRPHMTTVCNVHEIDVMNVEGHPVLVIKADRFLWNMVRMVASAIVKCTRGELDESDIISALNEGRDIKAGKLPPEGLYLWRVMFPQNIEKSMLPIEGVTIPTARYLGLYSMTKEIKKRVTPSHP